MVIRLEVANTAVHWDQAVDLIVDIIPRAVRIRHDNGGSYSVTLMEHSPTGLRYPAEPNGMSLPTEDEAIAYALGLLYGG